MENEQKLTRPGPPGEAHNEFAHQICATSDKQYT